MLFLELLYLHQLIRYLCRCFFLLICKNLHPQLAFPIACRYSPSKIRIRNLFFLCLQILSCKNLHPQLPFSLSCRYSPAKICIHNLPFLYLADTPLQKFASATCFFSILQILPCSNTLFYLIYSGFLLDFYFDFYSEF